MGCGLTSDDCDNVADALHQAGIQQKYTTKRFRKAIELCKHTSNAKYVESCQLGVTLSALKHGCNTDAQMSCNIDFYDTLRAYKITQKLMRNNVLLSTFKSPEKRRLQLIKEAQILSDHLNVTPTNEKSKHIIKKFIGTVSVDSGQLTIVDPSYVLPLDTDLKSKTNPLLKHALTYDKVTNLTRDDNIGMGWYEGIHLSNFGGDGTFPVIGTFKKQKCETMKYKCKDHTKCNRYDLTNELSHREHCDWWQLVKTEIIFDPDLFPLKSVKKFG